MTPRRPSPLLPLVALLVAVAVALPAMAQLVLLGSVAVDSGPGEPLRAVISTVDGTADASALESVEVAPRRSYEQLGLAWDPVLETAKVAIGRRPDGRAEVLVTTTGPVTAERLTLLLDVRSRGGRYQRSFLLQARGADTRVALPATTGGDPAPAVAIASPVRVPEPSWSSPSPRDGAAGSAGTDPPTGAAPAAGAEPRPEATAGSPATSNAAPPAAPPAAPAAAAPPSAGTPPANASPDRLPDGFIERRTVAEGTTLVEVARSVQPPGATLEQTIVALFGSNRAAFEDGDPRRLRPGATIDVPDALLIDAFDAREARDTVRRDWRLPGLDRGVPAPSMAAAPPAASATGPTPVPRATPRPAPSADAPPPPPRRAARPGDQLVLAPSGSRSTRAREAEKQAAFDAAMREATSRIEDLEKNIAGLNTLIALTEQRERALRDELARLRGTPTPTLASAESGSGRTASDAPARTALPVSAPVPAVRPDRGAWGEWAWVAAGLAAVALVLLLWIVRARRRRASAAADDDLMPDFGPTTR